MIFSLLLAAVAFVAVLPIVVPLMRSNRPVAERTSYDQAVYRDQLQELDRDISRGLITPNEAEVSRLEIQRRLLAADRRPVRGARLTSSPVLAAATLIFIAGGAVAFYLAYGEPGMPDLPYSSRQAEFARQDQQMPMRQAAEKLAARLKQNPADADGWVLYGRTLATLGDWAGAEDAYSHAVALGHNDPDTAAARAEMLVLQAGGTVTPAAIAGFQDLLKANPGNPVARYYLAAASLQAGEPKRAISELQALLADLPANAPMREQIGQTIAEAAKQAGVPMPVLAEGKPAAAQTGDTQVGAQAPSGQQMEMIRGMVAKLAAEQKANPTNLEGWLRLGQAYSVLHEPDKAADALDQALALKPGDPTILLQEARVLLADQPATAPLPPRTVALLQRIEAVDPNQPVVLWYLGMNAAHNQQPEEARRYWTELLSHVPSGSDNAKLVQEALDALPKNATASGK